MNYYYDTEFLEGTQKTWKGVSLPTIDLISIGIVCEDGREYYAISKDFNLKEAWADKLVRENILIPLVIDIEKKNTNRELVRRMITIKTCKSIINKYGKSNKQIAEEIKDFVSYKDTNLLLNHLNPFSKFEWTYDRRMEIIQKKYPHHLPKFYGYYSDYDHVALCWLFGKMINLPKGFPMYTIDLQQMLDEIQVKYITSTYPQSKDLKLKSNYPKQENEHSAIHDASWNKKLHEFIKQL